jgi:glycosyltransferase involved in cell wall biosynthesis
MVPLIEGAGGLAITPKDVPSIVAALDQYLALSDDELKAKGEQAYRYLQEQHDIEVFRQEYLDLIDTGLEQARKVQP